MPRMFWWTVIMVSPILLGALMVVCVPHLSSLWTLLFLMHVIIMPILMNKLSKREGLTLLAKVIPDTHLVRIMQHDGEVRYVLAYGKWGQTLSAHVYWLTEIGSIQLEPNGCVTGDCSYVYFWQPVDRALLTQMHLSYNVVDWDQLRYADYQSRSDYRQQLVSELKLNT